METIASRLASEGAYARSNPQGLTYASGEAGSLGHLSAARLTRDQGVKATHVPYQENSAAVESMLGGQTELLFGAVIDVIEISRRYWRSSA